MPGRSNVGRAYCLGADQILSRVANPSGLLQSALQCPAAQDGEGRRPCVRPSTSAPSSPLRPPTELFVKLRRGARSPRGRLTRSSRASATLAYSRRYLQAQHRDWGSLASRLKIPRERHNVYLLTRLKLKIYVKDETRQTHQESMNQKIRCIILMGTLNQKRDNFLTFVSRSKHCFPSVQTRRSVPFGDCNTTVHWRDDS